MISKTNILAIDLGFSSIKIAKRSADGTLHLDKINSTCARLDEPMETSDDEVFQLGTNYYALGTSALKVGRSKIIKMDDWN